MNYRRLGKTDLLVSELGFGAWAIGGSWGEVDDKKSLQALDKAIEMGVNFVDTADVYGDGRSEQLIAKSLTKLERSKKDKIVVATKFGRRSDPHTVDSYNYKNLKNYLERSLQNLRVDTIDLIQLHCPPTAMYYKPEVFEILDRFKQQGKIRHYGVSVEKVEEGLKAMEYPGVDTVQIIYNMFRQRPSELFFEQASKKHVGVIVRVPMASGLLTAKFDQNTQFTKDDHRNFNRHGDAFDKGETFAGIEFEAGLKAVKALESLKPAELTMAQFALRWILDNTTVSTAIPGCKTASQAKENFSASDGSPLSQKTRTAIAKIYRDHIASQVHQRW